MNLRRGFVSICVFTACLCFMLFANSPNRFAMATPVPKEVKKACPSCVCFLTSDTGFAFGDQPASYWHRAVLVDGLTVTPVITAFPRDGSLIFTTSDCSGVNSPIAAVSPTNYKTQYLQDGTPRCSGVIPANSLLEGMSFANPNALIPDDTLPSMYCPQ